MKTSLFLTCFAFGFTFLSLLLRLFTLTRVYRPTWPIEFGPVYFPFTLVCFTPRFYDINLSHHLAQIQSCRGRCALSISLAMACTTVMVVDTHRNLAVCHKRRRPFTPFEMLSFIYFEFAPTAYNFSFRLS